jgi:hypothetical protein
MPAGKASFEVARPGAVERQLGINAPHGSIYRVRGNVIQIARLVHLARYLPALIPED